MSGNPFRFGTPVGESLLIGREQEKDELLKVLREARNLVLLAPRGTGKSSLLHAVRAACPGDGMDVAYVDLFPAINSRRFAELYASALTLEPSRTVEDMQEAVRHLVPSFAPRVTISGEGRPALQLDLWDRDRDIQALMDRIFEVPAEMQAASDRPLAVVLDDFEDLVAVADEDLLRDLAVSARKQSSVSYVFVMRRPATVKRLFQQPKSPFYKLADPVRLDPVPEGEMSAGLQTLFAENGVQIERELVYEFMKVAANVPHYVQMLAHSMFEEAREEGAAKRSHLRAALSHILDSQAYAFKFQWDQLSPHQKNLVLAIAQGHTEKLHSQRMVVRLGLGSPSTVAKNLKVLGEREILRREEQDVHFVDPFFGLWLQRRMT